MPEQSPALPLAVYLRGREKRIVVGFLLVALVHGLIYVFLMPPWQHYEEPSHFEYAWLIASRLSLPEYPAFDPAKRREIASSMIENGFFARGFDTLPNFDDPNQPAWIGINVTGSLPLYHIIVAIPLRFLLGLDIKLQLYAGRLVSVAMYVLVVWIAYKIMCELVLTGHALRWIVPGTLALLPGFIDLMTGVNPDVGATLVFSIFSLASIQLILRGLSLGRLVKMVGALALCLLTRNTLMIALPLALAALAFTLYRSHGWQVAVTLLGVTAVVAAVSIFSWGDAALWYRHSAQEEPTRVFKSDAPVGTHAIALQVSPTSPEASEVSQPLLEGQVQELKGKTVTLGAWIWASVPTRAELPILSDGKAASSQQVDVETRPSFHAIRASVAPEAQAVQVSLRADPTQSRNQGATIYYDGVVLLEGEYPLDEQPHFGDSQGTRGNWAGREFTNVLRNSTGETAWVSVRPWVERLSQRFPWAAHLSPTLLVASLLDWQKTSWIYAVSANNLARTFWGRFGWGHIDMPAISYGVLNVISVLSLVGAAPAIWTMLQARRQAWKLAVCWLAVATVAVWGLVLVRGLFTALDTIYIPTARYAFPVIIPTVLLIAVGWRKWLAYLPGSRTVLYFASLGILDLVSFLSIAYYYHWSLS